MVIILSSCIQLSATSCSSRHVRFPAPMCRLMQHISSLISVKDPSAEFLEQAEKSSAKIGQEFLVHCQVSRAPNILTLTLTGWFNEPRRGT